MQPNRSTRLLDISLSLLLLTILSPLFFVTGVLIRMTSKGPILYRGLRVGRHGRLFPVYKFRTMFDRPPAEESRLTLSRDPRVTPLGKLLRITKIDELPQLWNVLRGQMSLVGPRPEDPKYVTLYDKEQSRLLGLRPGVTSPASIAYRHEETLLTGPNWEDDYVRRILPKKLQMEIDYQEGRTILSDLEVIASTILALFQIKGRTEE